MSQPNPITITMLAEAMWEEQETQLVGYPDDFAPFARAILRTIEEAGWQVVPKEATEDMRWAGWWAKDAVFSHASCDPMIAPAACYNAMLSSSPKIGEG